MDGKSLAKSLGVTWPYGCSRKSGDQLCKTCHDALKRRVSICHDCLSIAIVPLCFAGGSLVATSI